MSQQKIFTEFALLMDNHFIRKNICKALVLKTESLNSKNQGSTHRSMQGYLHWHPQSHRAVRESLPITLKNKTTTVLKNFIKVCSKPGQLLYKPMLLWRGRIYLRSVDDELFINLACFIRTCLEYCQYCNEPSVFIIFRHWPWSQLFAIFGRSGSLNTNKAIW